MQPTTVTVQTRFQDFDVFNHVNNVAFFALMESARVEVVRTKLPTSLRGQLMVRHAACDYEGEIRGGVRSVDITISVDEIGTSSFTLRHEIRAQGALVGLGRVVMVALDDRRSASRPLTADERAQLAADG